MHLACIVCGQVVPRRQPCRAGVADRLFKRHGRWRSETAKDGYVKDALETRLSVTKQLGV